MSKNKISTQDDEMWSELGLNDTDLQCVPDKADEEGNTTRLRDGVQHEGFDNNTGDSWIYPSNLPCRSYQMSIVQSALYRNTLVVLPTGLGKTFIAAVVMYNFYRWYPRGKIIFMAPTRPLVNQQIEACKKVMPFPIKDTIELSGKLPRSKRGEIWKTKRVFFATPQVVQSDIFGGRQHEITALDDGSFQEPELNDFPFDRVKLIVIDEAHKAKGKYAYNEVTQVLARKTKYFRVLALSATPGRTVEDVAEVCRNLLISHIEVRWETSFDVLPFLHKRTMDTLVVEMGDKIKEVREELLVIVDPYLRQLTESEVISGSLTNINRNFLLYEQKRYRDRSFHMGRHPQHSAITSNFAICISIYHALELLERHGLRVFLNYFEEDEDGNNKFILKMDPRLRYLVENLKKETGPNPFDCSAAPMTNGKIAKIPTDLDFGHPKFEKTRQCLLKHFENNKDSRAIVFCEYRESVMLIYRMLLQHVPLLNPRCFVGQGGTGSLRALTQKQQIQIMNDFRSGKSNILIATSIGEEGIDVGEVELIVCFDISTSNPMRFVQRIGRTGRKKNGHVVMIVTEGREQQLLREVLSNKDQINKKLLTSSVVQRSLYKYAPRLVPTEFKPKCVQMFIKPPAEDEVVSSPKSKKLQNKKKVTPKKNAQDLLKFFKTKPKELDKEDLEFFENDTNMTQAKPGAQTQQNIVNKLHKMKNLFKDFQSPSATQTQSSSNNSEAKINSSQTSIKKFFNDSCAKNKNREFLNEMVNECTNTVNLCDSDDGDIDMDIVESVKPSSRIIDAERVLKLKHFLKTTITKKEVLKRSKINDLGHHLRSNELSREMKILLLKIRPEYIKANLEQIELVNALNENEEENYSEEEKSIRELHNIISDIFGGLDKVEKFLDDLELEKYKQNCLESDSEYDEEDAQEMKSFQGKLDQILKEYGGDGKRHNNYDWIHERFKQTRFYKDKLNCAAQSNVQQSMVYENIAKPEDENTLNCYDDFSVIESKYCSQWQEFNNADIAYKSTPVQKTVKCSLKRDQSLQKACLHNRLEETEDNNLTNIENGTLNTSTNTKNVQNMLLMLENKLKETSLNEKTLPAPQDELQDLENVYNKKIGGYENHMLETESKILSSTHFEDFNLPEDDALIMAAAEAELKCTQNGGFNPLHDVNQSTEISKSINYLLSKEKINTSSLNSTPELDLSSIHAEKTKEPSLSPGVHTAPELCLQEELNIDMEAFMDPFPEEEELLSNSKLYTPNTSFVRETSDIFTERQLRSPITKPTINLNAKENIAQYQSPASLVILSQNIIEPATSPSTRLPTNNQKYERSPSLFDMYMMNTKGKGKLPKSLSNGFNISDNGSRRLKVSPLKPTTQKDESLVVIRNRKGRTSKRKIFDSDSEHGSDKEQVFGVSAIDSRKKKDDSSDLEEVAATQLPYEGSVIHQRRKRRRANCFIQQEACVSGSDHSGDEAERTNISYVHDSIVVSSDEDDPDQASTSLMQAMYLRSLKSPQTRRGTFKIPAPRVYNDRSKIFSQDVLPADTYSQYVPDSFVVAEEVDSLNDNGDISLCPLERAEQILKERRKAKKLKRLDKDGSKIKAKSKTRTKVHIIEDSSEDDDFV